jgi:hypothetical protein
VEERITSHFIFQLNFLLVHLVSPLGFINYSRFIILKLEEEEVMLGMIMDAFLLIKVKVVVPLLLQTMDQVRLQ